MITNAKFITSSANLSQAPNFAHSEVAFLGRSNVGKSSLINALTHQKNLAKSSATPGKTRLINFFEVSFKSPNLKPPHTDKNAPNAKFQSQNSQNSSNLTQIQTEKSQNAEFTEKFTLIFVDLPGFGYAKVSHAQRAQWDKNLDEFLRKRSAIKLFLHLIDSRHENLSVDESISEYLQALLSPTQRVIKVFTKADKLNQSQKTKLKKAFDNALLVSSTTRQGLDELENALVAQSLGL